MWYYALEKNKPDEAGYLNYVYGKSSSCMFVPSSQRLFNYLHVPIVLLFSLYYVTILQPAVGLIR